MARFIQGRDHPFGQLSVQNHNAQTKAGCPERRSAAIKAINQAMD
jgi:hypothetical protein